MICGGFCGIIEGVAIVCGAQPANAKLRDFTVANRTEMEIVYEIKKRYG